MKILSLPGFEIRFYDDCGGNFHNSHNLDNNKYNI